DGIGYRRRIRSKTTRPASPTSPMTRHSTASSPKTLAAPPPDAVPDMSPAQVQKTSAMIRNQAGMRVRDRASGSRNRRMRPRTRKAARTPTVPRHDEPPSRARHSRSRASFIGRGGYHHRFGRVEAVARRPRGGYRGTMLLYVVRDLLFVSKIREAAEPLGVAVQPVRDVETLAAAAHAARLVVLVRGVR